MAYRLGVDVGTTFTAAAVGNGAEPSMIGLGNRALQVPSVLFLTPEGKFLIGEAAERRGMIQPDRVVREFKRRIGDHVPILVAEMPFSPEMLTAELLKWVVATASERTGAKPAETIVTYPANWGPFKREVLDQVVTLADIGPSRSCPEPVAAAARYAARAQVEVGDRLAVYDMGGGTFDACVMEKTNEGFRMLGKPDGVEHLGGIEFDEALFQRVMTTLKDRLGDVDLSDASLAVGLARLRRDVVEAKEALSSDTMATIPVALPGLSTVVRLTRAETELLMRPAIQVTVEALARTIRSAGLEVRDLRAIILVGGSSRIPLVAEMLRDEFEVPLALDTHPKHDVALGATLVTSASSFLAPPASPHPEAPPARDPSRRDPTPPDPAHLPPETPPRQRGRGFANGLSTLLPQGAFQVFRERRVWVIASLLVLALVVAIVLVDRREPSGTAAPPPAAPSPASPSPADTTPPTGPRVVLDPDLPRSSALSPTQLIVPMSFDGDDGFDLYLADTESKKPGKRLTTSDSMDFAAVLAPDRRSIIFVRDPNPGDSTGRRSLKVISAAGTHGRDLFREPVNGCRRVSRPAWNPIDQTMVAVPCLEDKRARLFLMRTDGKKIGEVRVGDNPNPRWRVGGPSFSPDGKKLVFWGGLDPGGGALYVTAARPGARAGRLTSDGFPGRDTDPVWDKDGKTVTFARRTDDGTTDGNIDIYQVPANGGSAEALIEGKADEQGPSWSPSGTQLVYKSDEEAAGNPGKEFRVWVANEQGKKRQLLWTRGRTSLQGSPSWTSR